MQGKTRIWNSINRDKIKRKNFKKNEIYFLNYKYCLVMANKKNHKNFYFFNFIKKFHLNTSSARINNRCVYTSRTRWPLRRFKLSRMTFKDLFGHGLIHGVKRSSW